MSTHEPIPQQALTRGSDALVELPVTVWPTAQQPARTQRGDRYVPEGTAHPAKMLPAIARHAIDTFTAPGDLVLDPMCGVGTTLVEAVRKGRDALGIEYEHRWAEVTEANLTLAALQEETTGRGAVHVGDARQVLPDLAERYAGRAGLLVTSPPYGASVHGQVHAPGHRPVRKHDNRYGRDRANLAHRSLPMLLRGFTDILRRAVPLLRPGGVVAITTRPFRIDGELIDFPSLTLDAAINAGLDPVQRCVGLLAGLRDGKLVPRSSFFQLDYVRKLRDRGVPAWVIAHEDVLVLRVSRTCPSSGKLKHRRAGPESGSRSMPDADSVDGGGAGGSAGVRS
ncbi:TRM11 family SAM-dependent methyltransferase [Amycolatopsis nigrescens]|uniref:TRM11 family SAM-dependent methyltransferase n=1 Tax=Amycolatopsis nigrescens TaxID=381445 RepID=UPI000366C84C|nr:DNA methyltransferase [Amycolatopsis nigrescens]